MLLYLPCVDTGKLVGKQWWLDNRVLCPDAPSYMENFVNRCSCDIYISFCQKLYEIVIKETKPKQFIFQNAKLMVFASSPCLSFNKTVRIRKKKLYSALISYLANMRRSSGFWAAGTLRIASRSCSNKLARRFSVILLFRGESPPGINSALELSMLGLVRVMSSLLAIRGWEKRDRMLTFLSITT